jgi:hypothetical protein
LLLNARSIRAKRLGNGPIITPAMLPGSDGANINGPSLIRVPDWVPDRLGRYYLYFAHHSGACIRLAYADNLLGPWTIHEPGTLRLEDTPAARGHVASPDVHVDTDREQIVMYFHAPAANGNGQVSFVSTSRDGLRFEASSEALGLFYFRAFRHGDHWYALAKGGELYRSEDGLTGFTRVGNPFPPIAEQDRDHNRPGSVRHLAVHRRTEHLLDVYYTRIGDAPESILVSTIDLRPDCREWRASPPEVVLRPERRYEGAGLPTSVSRAGAAKGRENAVRDPAVYVEGMRVYLLYSVAGESGIAVADLLRTE